MAPLHLCVGVCFRCSGLTLACGASGGGVSLCFIAPFPHCDVVRRRATGFAVLDGQGNLLDRGVVQTPAKATVLQCGAALEARLEGLAEQHAPVQAVFVEDFMKSFAGGRHVHALDTQRRVCVCGADTPCLCFLVSLSLCLSLCHSVSVCCPLHPGSTPAACFPSHNLTASLHTKRDGGQVSPPLS